MTTLTAAVSVYGVPDPRPGNVRHEPERRDDTHQSVPPDTAAAAPGAPPAAPPNSRYGPSGVTSATEPQASRRSVTPC